MLVVISPAKRLDWSEVPEIAATVPAYLGDANALAGYARKLSKPKLQQLMGISTDLAKLNQERFSDFADAPAAQAVRPAARAFAGDTYAGLEAGTLDADAMRWAQDHLRILSGLYGLLRPCDGIQPYRLEMGSKLKTRRGGSLYDYWGDQLSRGLNEAAAHCGAEVLVNCASQEYFGAVDLDALALRVITPVFMEDRPGGPKIISFAAKKARGAMARFVVEHRLTDPEELKGFATGGYTFQPGMSDGDRWVFLRLQDGSLNAA
ncbi:peroxide stress protein YaaA [Actibacterium sp. 188UL27-1]|uniref:peroxide stress protein YaaA n=1 Tax=Actibacterium sp. 188UL27-1 TaxID=2786961 RepID=UPI00195EBFCD|nr:peroxide stress protein YaaA [Actibacterium sp. 188UL27-1]MBM7067109.1 peroxide stress protein YaaA [Actibacterium sp. 188UL27-1]